MHTRIHGCMHTHTHTHVHTHTHTHTEAATKGQNIDIAVVVKAMPVFRYGTTGSGAVPPGV